MTTALRDIAIEDQIAAWRSYLQARRGIHAADVVELEDHLRENIATLTDAGLSDDEAFLVAVKRMGELSALSREFAREHSDRLWKQLVAPAPGSDGRVDGQRDGIVAFSLAVVAAMLLKTPELFGLRFDTAGGFYLLNIGFFVLPLLAGYFAWRGGRGVAEMSWLAALFLAAAAVVNLYPFEPEGTARLLAALHLPIALWLVVGIAYAGDRWNDAGGRMDFIRFSGELFIYYVLIALGGGVLTALTAMMFEALAVDAEYLLTAWLIPCGAVGAVLVGSWLVESKQSVVENMAPVLARLFTPILAAVLIAFLATLLWTGRGLDIERDLLLGFDLLLVLVLGLLLYSISARDPALPPGPFDAVQFVLVVAALLADAVALSAILARITEFGFTPNRLAALGVNVVLLVNLARSALLYLRIAQGRSTFAALEKWQTDYLPVYAGWAAVVVLVFPLMFGFG